MNIAASIRRKINKFPRGYVFTYRDVLGVDKTQEAVIKALNRMSARGEIKKIAKGKYYKPEKTSFGELDPPLNQVVKDFLEKDGKVVGYLTGTSIYNSFGFTTQVSNTIQIGRNEIRPSLKRGKYKISFVKQKNVITKENIPLLQILDVMRFIKKIPDTTIEETCKKLKVIVKKLSETSRRKMVKLSLKYPPRVRALLGAILEEIGDKKNLSVLRYSLNPISKYDLNGATKILKKAKEWNIK